MTDANEHHMASWCGSGGTMSDNATGTSVRCYVCGEQVVGALKHPGCVSRYACDWEGCDRHPALGDTIHRVSPKGQPFVVLCEEHYAKARGKL